MDLPSQSPQPVPASPPVSPAPVPPPPPPPVMVAKKFPLQTVIIVVVGLVVLVLVGLLVSKILGLTKTRQPVTLTYWGLWEAEALVKPLIDQYQADHPDVKINYLFQSPREYRERLQNALSSGKGPDIFRLHNTWIAMFKSDLTPVPPEVYSAAAFEATFYPVAKADLRVGSNYVAIPLEIDGLALFANEDLLSQAGKSVPQTWEDLRRTAVDLAVCESADGSCSAGDKILVAGVALGTADNVDHWQDILAVLMLQNNVNLNSPSGPSAEEALQYYTIFNRTDHIWDSTLPNSTQAFAGGKLALYFGPSWRVFDIQVLAPNLKFAVYPLPQLPLETSRGEQPITWASYWAEGVNKGSPHLKEAWNFLGHLSSKDSLQKLYQLASSTRAFGEPYGRVDMADLLKNAPLVGPFISQAPHARSWYIASNTFDGPTGINSLLSKYFADAVNSVNEGRSAAEAVKTLAGGVNQVLSKYGLVAPLPLDNR